MAEHFDLAIIGTGVAAQTIAYPCREAGWNVAIVDWRPYGGTCQLRGCDPKRVLVGVEDAVAAIHRLRGKGAGDSRAGIAWPELMRFKRTFTDPAPAAVHRGLVDAGVRAYQGHARFTSPSTLTISGNDEAEIEARSIVIAAGAEPQPLGIPGDDLVITSEQFLNLDQIPERIVFLGGGYISFEFAYLTATAGAQVTILHRGDRPLKAFDRDLVGSLMTDARERGIDPRLNVSVIGIERTDNALIVRATNGDGEAFSIETDLVVHGAGRGFDFRPLELERAGIAYDRSGIKVDASLRSVSHPSVFAAGDAADTPAPKLTPVARLEGRIVTRNLLQNENATPDYTGVATVVYTDPPLAAVGLTEERARAQGLSFAVHTADTSGWYSSRRLGLGHTRYKVLVESGTDSILGAHLLAANAEEVINLFALAMRAHIPAPIVKSVPFAYPTGSSDLAYML